MGLLDELKQQAEEKRAEVAAAEAEQEARFRAYRENIQPRMVKLFTYLSELVEHLNYISKKIQVNYPIKTYGELGNLAQQDYKIRSDSIEGMKKIDVGFDCYAEGRLEFEVENKLYIERLEEYLSSARLNFTCQKSKDSRHNVTSARFRIDKLVPVQFEFRVDVDAGNIGVVIRNYHGLHIDRFTLDPAIIDDAWLDELGKFIVRKESKLFRLEISEEDRQRIRDRLEGKQDKKKKKKKAAVKETKPSTVDDVRSREVSAAASREISAKDLKDSFSKVANSESSASSDESNGAIEVSSRASFGRSEQSVDEQILAKEMTGPHDVITGIDSDNDLVTFQLHFSALPVATKPYESLDEMGKTIIQRIDELESFPPQLLSEAVKVLEGLNHTTLKVADRIKFADMLFSRIYPTMLKLFLSSANTEEPVHDAKIEAMLENAISIADGLATVYKHAYKSSYSSSSGEFNKSSASLTEWGFRILEMIRLEQRLRALRYQKLPHSAWLDANQVFFSLLLHNATDNRHHLVTLMGLEPSKNVALKPATHSSSVRRIYLSIQLFGVLDVITWPASLFHFPDAYLEETEGGLKTEQDNGEMLPEGCLITFLMNDGPPLHKRNDAIPAPALRIDFSGLFTRIVKEHESLANMIFLSNVDEAKLSKSLVALEEQDRIPVLEMMLLALQRRERKHKRHAVFGTEKVAVNFGFEPCYTILSSFAQPEESKDDKAVGRVDLIQKKSIELVEKLPAFHTVPWKIINFSTGGLLVGNDTGKFNEALQVGQLVAFKPKESSEIPLMGFIGRIQRPIEYQIELSIIRMAKYGESALAQDQADLKNEESGGKPVILIQDFQGRWQLIVLHSYGYTTGTPLKLIRSNGKRILLRLGDIWMTKREFTVFEVRSAAL